jgi:peptide-methionine (R)-S-oxide reductase
MKRRSVLLGALSAVGGGALASFLPVSRGTAGESKTFEFVRTEDEWRALLTPAEYRVLREHGTERAGSSPLDKVYDPGTYHCAGCDLALFSSETKFDSRTGWPSFHTPIEGAVGTAEDNSFFMKRTEVHCARCGGHLGHVFNDGPPPTGLRYCINGVALKFVPA